MIKLVIILLLFSLSVCANTLDTALQTPHPLFLKQGYSAIIEFSESPIRVVVGDHRSFQVEKMDKSLVVRPLVVSASSNLFVYFKDAPPKLFTLNASDDNTPTLFVRFDLSLTKMIQKNTQSTETKNKQPIKTKISYTEGLKLKSAVFDKTKDYLTIDYLISAGQSKIEPIWEEIFISSAGQKIKPYKIWSERSDIQKDTEVKARLTFLRPDVSKLLKNVSVIVPLKNRIDVLKLNLGKVK